MHRSHALLIGLLAVGTSLLGSAANAHPPASADSYRWVSPPDGATGGGTPEGRTAEVTPELLAAGIASIWTPDAQAVVTIETERIEASARVTITALDPSSLPALPDLLPNGNAYRVEVHADGWQPDAVELLLATPFLAQTVHRLSPDGWTDLEAAGRPDGRIAVSAAEGGTFLASTTMTDGHDSLWASFSHDPVRPWLAGAAIVLACAGTMRRNRKSVVSERASRSS